MAKVTVGATRLEDDARSSTLLPKSVPAEEKQKHDDGQTGSQTDKRKTETTA